MGLGVEIAINGIPQLDLTQVLQVEVYEHVGRPATYRLMYDVDILDGDFPLLVDSRLQPGSVVSISVPVGLSKECLIKGPVHGHHVQMIDGGAGSRLAVKGSDSSIVMDREVRTVQWKDVTVSHVVTQILSRYGFAAQVTSTQEQYLTNKHSLIQRDSDLRFVHRVARRQGFLFWLRCNPLGLETAHFAPPPVDGIPDTDLTINQTDSVLDSFDITWDVERPTQVVGQQLDLNTLTSMTGDTSSSSIQTLGSLSLSQIAGAIRNIHLSAPTDDAGSLQARGKSLLTEAGWFLKATCRLSLHQVSRPIRAHTLVTVSGAGSRYSGSYFVAGVRHVIDAAAHVMELTLLRNGWSA